MDLMKQLDLGYEGFARANAETLEALTKAMEAGSGVDAGVFTGGRALTPESLDTTLVNVLHSTDEARFFQRLKKVPVKSVVHQWDYRDEVGEDGAGWVAEGGTSEETDQNIERRYVTAKYLQTLRKVTLQAASSNMIEDAIAIEKEAGALWIVRNTESALFNGNDSNMPYIINGLNQQIPAANVLDMRGKDAQSVDFENFMNEGARQIRDYYGVPTSMFTSTMVMQDVQALLRDRIRFGTGNVTGGAVFKTYPTPFGEFDLIDDVFIKEGIAPAANTFTGIPGQPTIGSTSTPADAASEFTAADAGQYVYKVAPINAKGEGPASAEEIVTGVIAGDKVVLPVTKGSGADPTAYKVYRSILAGVTGAVVKYAFTVPYTASPMDVEDYNSYLPGTSSVYLLNLNTAYNAIEWVQFLPMMKFDLYPTNAAVYPFLMLLFGSLAVKKPNHHVRVKNISPSNLGWF